MRRRRAYLYGGIHMGFRKWDVITVIHDKGTEYFVYMDKGAISNLRRHFFVSWCKRMWRKWVRR